MSKLREMAFGEAVLLAFSNREGMEVMPVGVVVRIQPLWVVPRMGHMISGTSMQIKEKSQPFRAGLVRHQGERVFPRSGAAGLEVIVLQ